MNLAVVIMAAGKGTRMRSKTPKVLHPILGKPMLRYAVDVAHSLDPSEIVVVIGHDADRIRIQFENEVEFVVQSPQLGTGHAVQQAQARLEDKCEAILVVPSDLPLLSPETLKHTSQGQAPS